MRHLVDLQETIYGAVNNDTQEMFYNTWIEVEYRLDIPDVINGSDVEAY